MRSITRNECPNTRAEFVAKWNTDHVFRARATARGFKVMFDNVIFPDGRVATPTVRQGQPQNLRLSPRGMAHDF